MNKSCRKALQNFIINTIGVKPLAPKALLHLVSVIVFVFMAYKRLRIM